VVWAWQNKILQACRGKTFVPGARRRPVPIDWNSVFTPHSRRTSRV